MFKGFRTNFWEVDHPLCDVRNNLIGAHVFEKGKIYKPTWTKIGLRPIFVLRWKKLLPGLTINLNPFSENSPAKTNPLYQVMKMEEGYIEY